MSGAQRRKTPLAEKGGAGKGAKPLSPPQHTAAPEREERSGIEGTFRLLVMKEAPMTLTVATWVGGLHGTDERVRYEADGCEDFVSVVLSNVLSQCPIDFLNFWVCSS